MPLASGRCSPCARRARPSARRLGRDVGFVDPVLGDEQLVRRADPLVHTDVVSTESDDSLQVRESLHEPLGRGVSLDAAHRVVRAARGGRSLLHRPRRRAWKRRPSPVRPSCSARLRLELGVQVERLEARHGHPLPVDRVERAHGIAKCDEPVGPAREPVEVPEAVDGVAPRLQLGAGRRRGSPRRCGGRRANRRTRGTLRRRRAGSPSRTPRGSPTSARPPEGAGIHPGWPVGRRSPVRWGIRRRPVERHHRAGRRSGWCSPSAR